MKKSKKIVITAMVICMTALPMLIGCSGKKEVSASGNSASTGSANSGTETASKSTNVQKPNPASDFEYDFNDDGKSLHIKKFIGKGSTVVFPAEIEDYPVTKIGLEGYYYQIFEMDGYSKVKDNSGNSPKANTSVKSIVIPEGIEFIGQDAFNKCDALESVILPSTIKKIEKYAFYRCTSLKKITLPDTLTKIAGVTFRDCKSLTDVNIPASIEIIEEAAFEDSPLTNLKIPESITSIKFTVDGYARPDNQAFWGSQPPLAMRKRLQDLGYGGSF